MPQKYTAVYPPAYRTEAVRALRTGRQPEELAREFGVSGQTVICSVHAASHPAMTVPSLLSRYRLSPSHRA